MFHPSTQILGSLQSGEKGLLGGFLISWEQLLFPFRQTIKNHVSWENLLVVLNIEWLVFNIRFTAISKSGVVISLEVHFGSSYNSAGDELLDGFCVYNLEWEDRKSVV